MQTLVSFIPLIYLLVAIPYAAMGLYAWKRSPAVAVLHFAWMMVSMALWSFGYGLEIFLPNLSFKIIVSEIEYIGIVSIPLFLLGFALEYTGRGHFLKPRNQVLLWCVPLLILIAIWTNEFHGLMWDSARVEESFGLRLLTITPGPLFWLNIAYCYLLLLIATLILIMEFSRRPGIYRFQAGLVIIGVLSPWIGSAIYLANIGPIPNLDLTPLLFIPTSLALGWAITRFRLLDLIPLEHVSVLQNMRDAVVVLDAHHRILYLNPIAESLLACREHEAIGQPFSRVSSAHAQILVPRLIGNEEQFEVRFSEEANAPTYEVNISPMSFRRGPASGQPFNHVVILHNISLRKEAELLLSRREAILEAISLAAERFLMESTWEHTIPGVLEKIGQAADLSRVYVFMNYTNEKGIVHSSQCYEWAAPGVTPQISNPALQHMPLREAGFGRWVDILQNGHAVYGNVSDFPESEKELLEQQQIGSLAVMPIFVEGCWWGFIGFDECRCERRWMGVELEALHTAANIFGSAEARARTEQTLLRRQRTSKMLQDIVLAALQTSDLSSMSEALVEHLGKLINADGCFLSLWDEKNQQSIPLAAYGPYKEMYPSLSPQAGEKTFTASALKIGHTLVVEDTYNSPHVSHRIANLFSTRSALVLPLIAGKKRLGAIILASNRPRRFQPEEIAVSEQATNLIALALEKFQAVEHARRRVDESETLRKATAAVTETLRAEEAVARILEQLAQVIPYDTASVQLLDGDELVIVGGRGWENEADVVGMRFPIPGDNPNTIVIETGQPHILSDAPKVYPAFSNPPYDHIRSWLGVPMIFQKRTIGVLAMDSSRPNYFSTENTVPVVAFADQVAIILENSRLFSEVHSQALTDDLTGLYNRRGLFERGKVEFARAANLGFAFSAIMIDLDHFKAVNDTYGHSVGDQVLREFANRCKSCVREFDFVGRYGGEEIVILLPEADLDTSLRVAERLRTAIAGRPVCGKDDLELNITASLGVAHRDENTTTLEILIARADQAMYVAKHKGRNRIASSV